MSPPEYDSAHSWALYQGTARRLVHLLKYEQVLPVGRYLAGQIHSLPLPPVDLVIPVPLGRKRRRDRGYNQAELIARSLSRLRRLPCEPGWLQRSRDTRSQAGLDAAERERNVRDAFRAARKRQLKGKRILLVDDVLTTGATVRAAAAALRAGGAAEIHVVTVARADLEHDLATGLKPVAATDGCSEHNGHSSTDVDWGPNSWRSLPRRPVSS